MYSERFNIKVYTVQPFADMTLTAWTGSVIFKKTLNIKQISSWIKFTNELWVWYWALQLTYNSDDTTDVIVWDMIEIYKWSYLLYYGKVTERNIELSSMWTIQQISCKWFQTVLDDFIFTNLWNRTFTLNTDPNLIIQDILWQANTEVDYFSADYTNMINVWSSANIEFDNNTLLEALQKVLAVTSYYFAMRANGVVYFAPLPTTATHNFEFNNDIRNITYLEKLDDMVNYFFLTYDWWTTFWENTTSEFTYWSKQHAISNSSIKNVTTADAYVASYIAEKALLQEQIKIVVNNSYATETLYPWQMINVSNCPLEIKEKIIKRVEYTDKWVALYLNEKETLEKALYKLIS